MNNTDDYLVYNGGALKSLSDTGKVGGFLVLFEATDLQGEYFTRSTDYWLEGKSLLPLLWRHGLDAHLGHKKLTHVYHNLQQDGLWIEGKLPLRSSNEIDQIWDGVQRGEIGLSSGSSSHLVKMRFNPARNAKEITSWPVTEGSLTPSPVQPESRAIALKSLQPTEFEFYRRRENPRMSDRARAAITHFHQVRGRAERSLPEMKARQIYVDLLISRHEQRMREFDTSVHADSREEEQAYYGALASLANYRFNRVRSR